MKRLIAFLFCYLIVSYVWGQGCNDGDSSPNGCNNGACFMMGSSDAPNSCVTGLIYTFTTNPCDPYNSPATAVLGGCDGKNICWVCDGTLDGPAVICGWSLASGADDPRCTCGHISVQNVYAVTCNGCPPHLTGYTASWDYDTPNTFCPANIGACNGCNCTNGGTYYASTGHTVFYCACGGVIDAGSYINDT